MHSISISQLRRVWVVAAALIVSGCAGSFPVPGGDDDENKAFYQSAEELKLRVDTLQPGMAKDLVFSILGRTENEFTRLDRPAITENLYGGNGAGFNGTLEQQEQARIFLQSLEGYRFHYKFIDRDLGFSSPIRVRRDESGYNYTLTLVFREGRLFDKPSLSGGTVTGGSSKTIFDYLTPGLLLQ